MGLWMDAAVAADGKTLRRASWLANATRNVRARWDERGCALQVAGIGEFLILRDGGETRIVSISEGAGEDEVMQALLGPAKILALALRGVFCLHASAVARDDAAVVFVGESGQGKSALAAYLRGAGWQRLADDILPAQAAANGAFVALPDFPQLKLSLFEREEQARQSPANIRAVCALNTSADESAIPRLMPLSASETMKVVLRHTAAAQLFDGALMRQHFAFAHALGACAAGGQLRYARKYESLPQAAILINYLARIKL